MVAKRDQPLFRAVAIGRIETNSGAIIDFIPAIKPMLEATLTADPLICVKYLSVPLFDSGYLPPVECVRQTWPNAASGANFLRNAGQRCEVFRPWPNALLLARSRGELPRTWQ